MKELFYQVLGSLAVFKQVERAKKASPLVFAASLALKKSLNRQAVQITLSGLQIDFLKELFTMSIYLCEMSSW